MVARIVHGNKVKAELLPWHFKANILKTTLRFVVLLNALDPALLAFAVWHQEPQDLDFVEAQKSGLLEPIVFGLETVLLECFSQQVLRGSLQMDLANSGPSSTFESIGFLAVTTSSVEGLWA